MSEFQWDEAFNRAGVWKIPFNHANRRYGIDGRQRLVHYFSHVIPETDFLKFVKESDNKTGTYLKSKPYYPYYGRGLIQLTWKDAYKSYGKFRSFTITEHASSKYFYAGWNPDELLAMSNTIYHGANCADSAGYYISQASGMKKQMDAGIAKTDAIAVSKFVNGQVAIENLNGLDARLQSILFIRDVLLDMPADAISEKLDFDWRRNSEQELTMKNGKMSKAFVKTASPWSIDVSLAKQRPKNS
jgi:predicted chitinase